MGTALLLDDNSETAELSDLDLDIQMSAGESFFDTNLPVGGSLTSQECMTPSCNPTQSGVTHTCSLLSMCRSCC